MSDCDLRIRWRAAHSVRRLAAFCLYEPLDAWVNLYDHTTEHAFRAANEPFYWIAAQLWSVIALNRIAYETPAAIAGHLQKILHIATDESFPHVLIRAFAKDASLRLLDSGCAKLSAKDRNLLAHANTGRVNRQKKNRTFGRPRASGDKRRRAFDFDRLDTVPYWYEGATAVFADISMEEFLDAAEGWIIDRWKIQPGTSRWGDQSRRYRFSDRKWTRSSHSHGSEPTLEHFSTYLERHAMFCSVGELLRSRPLLQSDDDDSFDGWLKRKPRRGNLWVTTSVSEPSW
jgi:hypothetical protein